MMLKPEQTIIIVQTHRSAVKDVIVDGIVPFIGMLSK